MTDAATREGELIREATVRGTRSDGRRVIAELADEILPLLIARLAASSLGELEVRHDGWSVRLRRPITTDAPESAVHDERAARHKGRQERGRPTAGEAGVAPGRPERGRSEIGSPAVGYFVPRDGVAVGSVLRAGDAIGQIDVLGVRQDVVAAEDGILARFDVEPGQAVEYGQPIARIEPRG